jgi:hypothetical protein
MPFARTIVGVAAATWLVGAPALADPQHGHPAAPQPHVTRPPSGAPTAPKTSTKTTPPTMTTPASGTATKTTTTTSGTAKATKATSGATAHAPIVNPIAAKISAKPQLNARITAMLPAHMSLDRASRGFKNQGQFIAALHVSKNLGIPFSDLKSDMTRKHMSLGQSIQDLKKSAASTTEAKKGETEANADLKRSTSRVSISDRISSSTPLNAKVQALLPSGMTLNQASKGFTSESQFLAALHASKDLNIPFVQIKSEMTGGDHDSLARAIQELKPAADATTAARTARTEAAADIRATSTAASGDHDGDNR